MIKLRVEWHHKCLGCGTQLVTDFLDDSDQILACPWCACSCEPQEIASNGELREYVFRAVKQIEETANGKITIKN